jgi:hypothetical protein
MLHLNLLLWGGLATSVPLIIHLLNRRRFRVVRWAAMEFVLKAVKHNKKRVRLENLLLLLLRMLLILFIALIVARPWSSGGIMTFLPGASESIERIFIIDDSASLDQKFGGETAYDRSLKSVVKFCDDLVAEKSLDVVTIVLGSQPDKAFAPRLTPQAAKEHLGRLPKKPVDVPINLVAAVKTVTSGAASKEADKESGDERRQILYVMTDMRRVDWVGVNQEKAKDLAQQLRDFSREDKTEILLVDVASNDTGNLGVIDFKCRERIVVTEVPTRFEATIKNFGRSTIEDVQIMLKVGQSSVPARTIDEIGPGQTKVVRLSHTFREPGVEPLSIKLVGGRGEKDILARDDQRHLSIEVFDSIRVLVIDGEPSTESFQGEVDFLVPAMAPPGDTLSGVLVKKIREDDILDEILTRYHAIVVCNLEYWPEERLLALHSFVKHGGGLAFFLGDQVDSSRYMRDFWNKGKGLLPCPIGELEGSGDPEKPFRFTAPENKHLLTKLFQGNDNIFLRKIRFWKRFAIPDFDPEKLGKEEISRKPGVVLSFDDKKNTPAIVERTFGEGRVLLLNTSADQEWNNWAKNLSYVIVNQELARFLAPSASAQRNLSAGQPLRRGITPSQFQNEARLRLPGYPKIAERKLFFQRPNLTSPRQWLTIDDTQFAGIYSLILKSRQGGDLPAEVTEAYAVNLTASEGHLARIDKAQLLASLPGVRLQVTQLVDTNLLELTQGQRKELWKICLFIFFCLLIAEGALAQHLGRHRVVPLEA